MRGFSLEQHIATGVSVCRSFLWTSFSFSRKGSGLLTEGEQSGCWYERLCGVGLKFSCGKMQTFATAPCLQAGPLTHALPVPHTNRSVGIVLEA